jgi:hypothetical protein
MGTLEMATFHGRYFQVALDAIEQLNRAENLTTPSNQLVRAISSFGYQFLCCLSGRLRVFRGEPSTRESC